jgi:hypothetical protein
LDSSFWGRPEDYDIDHSCVKVPSSKTATDLISSMSSAFSGGSIIFRNFDFQLSSRLLDAAVKLHNQARMKGKDSLKSIFPDLFSNYPYSGSVEDKLLESSLMLDIANGNTIFYDQFKQHFSEQGLDVITEMAWDNRSISLHYLLFKISNDQTYLTPLKDYFFEWIQSQSNINSLSTFSNVSDLHPLLSTIFWALISLKEFSPFTTFALESWAKSQLDFILGLTDSGVNIMIGYSDNFPLNPRHKGSSCPEIPNTCTKEDETKTTPNPNIVIGGVIKGLNPDLTLNDDRTQSTNEIRLINNAPIPGILAAIMARFGDLSHIDQSLFPSTTCNDSASDYTNLHTSNLDLFERFLLDSSINPFVNYSGNF